MITHRWRGTCRATCIEVDLAPWGTQQVHLRLQAVIQGLVIGWLLLIDLASIV